MQIADTRPCRCPVCRYLNTPISGSRVTTSWGAPVPGGQMQDMGTSAAASINEETDLNSAIEHVAARVFSTSSWMQYLFY